MQSGLSDIYRVLCGATVNDRVGAACTGKCIRSLVYHILHVVAYGRVPLPTCTLVSAHMRYLVFESGSTALNLRPTVIPRVGIYSRARCHRSAFTGHKRRVTYAWRDKHDEIRECHAKHRIQ